MIEKGDYVYIMMNVNRTVLYIGVTSGLYSRVYQHKNGEGSKFTKKYNCTDVVYYKFYDEIETAIERLEKGVEAGADTRDKSGFEGFI